MDFDSTEMPMFYAENGLPAYGTIAPIGGIGAALQMLPMLARISAEWLAAAVLAQMSRRGTPPIYNFLPDVADRERREVMAEARRPRRACARSSRPSTFSASPTPAHCRRKRTGRSVANFQASLPETRPSPRAGDRNMAWRSASGADGAECPSRRCRDRS
jgi:hypothetical protein